MNFDGFAAELFYHVLRDLTQTVFVYFFAACGVHRRFFIMNFFNVFNLLWKMTEKGDKARMSGLVHPEGIVRRPDIPYLDDGDRYHLLDVYYPENNNGRLPVIIDIHGGGWMYGDKDLNRFYCEYLAERGFVVFAMSYRLAPCADVRAQLGDVNASLIKIKELLAEFPCDADRVTLTGDSAGGQLAAYTAAFASSESLRRKFGKEYHGIKFSKLVLTSPVPFMNENGVMGLYTRMMWGEKPSLGKSTARYMGIDEMLDEVCDFPPTLLITSTGDFVARSQTHRLHGLFLKNGIETRLLDYPKYEGKTLLHVFGVTEPYSPAGRDCLDRTARFILDK